MLLRFSDRNYLTSFEQYHRFCRQILSHSISRDFKAKFFSVYAVCINDLRVLRVSVLINYWFSVLTLTQCVGLWRLLVSFIDRLFTETFTGLFFLEFLLKSWQSSLAGRVLNCY